MGKLFCIMGKSSSGKDTIFKNIMADSSIGLLPVVTYTTRPKRSNETNGVEYNFITEKDVENYRINKKLIEVRCYDTVIGPWYYCTVDDGKIDLKNHSYLNITTLEAYKSLQIKFRDDVVPIYINVEDGLRLTRALEREKLQKKPDYREMCRRFLSDSEDFSEDNLKKVKITKIFNNISEQECETEIKDYIKSFEGQIDYD